MSEHRRGKGCGEEGHDPETCHCFLHVELDAMRARAEAAEAECLEQARLNGMGSEREAKLQTERDAALARVRELEQSSEVLKTQRHTQKARSAELEEMVKTLKKVNQDQAVEIEELERRPAWGTHPRITELEKALRDVLEIAASCPCEEAWTGRDLHAPECHYDEVEEARAVLEKK